MEIGASVGVGLLVVVVSDGSRLLLTIGDPLGAALGTLKGSALGLALGAFDGSTDGTDECSLFRMELGDVLGPLLGDGCSIAGV